MTIDLWSFWNFLSMLKTYKICNLTVGFLKYEFNNKLLGDATLLRVTLGVTWTQPMGVCVCIYIYINR